LEVNDPLIGSYWIAIWKRRGSLPQRPGQGPGCSFSCQFRSKRCRRSGTRHTISARLLTGADVARRNVVNRLSRSVGLPFAKLGAGWPRASLSLAACCLSFQSGSLLSHPCASAQA